MTRLSYGPYRFALTASLVLGLSLMASLTGKQPPPMPQPRKDVIHSGCTATLDTIDHKTWWWHLKVWVEYSDHSRWSHVYSIRDGKEDKKTLEDCAYWLKEFKKLR